MNVNTQIKQKKAIKSIFKILFSLIEAICLLLVMAILIFSNSLNTFLPIETNDVLIILVGVTCVQILSNYFFTEDMKQLNTKHELKYLTRDTSFKHVLPLKKVRIYSINSHVMLESFRNTDYFTAQECVILLRYREDDSELYKQKVLEDYVRGWRMLLEAGKITTLKIVGYNNFPDHYYTLFDDKVLMTDVINFDSKDYVGQPVSRDPLLIYSRTIETKEMIRRYINNFDNLVDHYQEDGMVLFDSTINTT